VCCGESHDHRILPMTSSVWRGLFRPPLNVFATAVPDVHSNPRAAVFFRKLCSAVVRIFVAYSSLAGFTESRPYLSIRYTRRARLWAVAMHRPPSTSVPGAGARAEARTASGRGDSVVERLPCPKARPELARPALADAVKEAGCSDPDILIHSRKPGEHVRGCWVTPGSLERRSRSCLRPRSAGARSPA
jgi:hypothetical protein